MNIQSGPVYTDGDFRVYRYTEKHFVHTFKNIVVCERGAINKRILSNLKNDVRPMDEGGRYHHYERPKQAMKEGIEAATKLKFIIQ